MFSVHGPLTQGCLPASRLEEYKTGCRWHNVINVWYGIYVFCLFVCVRYLYDITNWSNFFYLFKDGSFETNEDHQTRTSLAETKTEKRTPSHNIQSRDVCDDIAECLVDDLTNMGIPATYDENMKRTSKTTKKNQ